jgi:hypothetical protein
MYTVYLSSIAYQYGAPRVLPESSGTRGGPIKGRLTSDVIELYQLTITPPIAPVHSHSPYSGHLLLRRLRRRALPPSHFLEHFTFARSCLDGGSSL